MKLVYDNALVSQMENIMLEGNLTVSEKWYAKIVIKDFKSKITRYYLELYGPGPLMLNDKI